MKSLLHPRLAALPLTALMTLTACGTEARTPSSSTGETATEALELYDEATGFTIHTRQEPSVGVAVNVRVEATDAEGNIDPNYVGVATIQCSDTAAILPPALAFTELDHGKLVFPITFYKAGKHTLTITDPSGHRARRTVDVISTRAGCAEALQSGAACDAHTAACCADGLACEDMFCVPKNDPTQSDSAANGRAQNDQTQKL